MNFQTIEYFLAVEENRSITKAAQSLYITQQTLSAHIASLEKEVGCQLFVRHVPLELTYAGSVFLRYAQSISRDHRSLLREMSDIAKNESGILRVGVTHTRGRIVMPSLVQALQERHPGIQVQITDGTNEALERLLVNDDVDIAIGRFTSARPGIERRVFYQEEIVLIVAETLLDEAFADEKETMWAQLQAGDLAGLQKLTYVAPHREDIAGQVEEMILSRAGAIAQMKAGAEDIQTLIRLAANGVGACFCPENAVCMSLSASEQETVRVLRFSTPETQCDISFIWKADSYQWSIMDDFMQCGVQLAPSF